MDSIVAILELTGSLYNLRMLTLKSSHQIHLARRCIFKYITVTINPLRLSNQLRA